MTCNNFFDKKKFETVLITGGSSGIGKAVAIELLRVHDGKLNVIITGRNSKRLENARKELESELASNGTCKVIAQEIDVCNQNEMKQFIQKMDSQFTIDLIIANAGTHPEMLDIGHYFVSSKVVLDVNCQGVLNTILPIIPLFQDRKRGHIACVGSLAGYVPNSMSSHYSASKAYVRFVCDDLRPKLKLIGNIDVSYIAPGFVESNMASYEDAGHAPGFMKADKAAKIIVNGLISNHSVIMFPSWVANLVWLMGSVHPILWSLISDKATKREHAAQSIGFFHEFDPDDEFGGEC